MTGKSTFLIAMLFFLSVAYASAFDMRLSAETLSVTADRVPLQDILTHFARQGIRIRIDPRIDPLITVSFRNRSLQQGVNTILKSLNHVLIWEAIPGLDGHPPRLAEIQVFQPGLKEYMRPLAPPSLLSLEKDAKTGALFVKNELLVTVRPGIGMADFQKLLLQIGGRIVDYYAATGVYRIHLPDGSDVLSLVEEITAKSGIAHAEPHYAYSIVGPRPLPGVSDSALFPVSGAGNGAPIAIIDTGLAAGAGLGRLVLASLDTLSPGTPIADTQGHGTQMAYIASGMVRPFGVEEDGTATVPLIPIRGIDDNGHISGFQLLQGIEYAIRNGARVLSLSWGGDAGSEFMEQALNDAASKGLIVVASAGNEPTGTPVYPAAYSSVIGVGALGRDGTIWDRSNFGSSVSVYAPGVASLPVGYKGDPGSYAGTSIAAAFAANRIALYLSSHPGADIHEILDALSVRAEGDVMK